MLKVATVCWYKTGSLEWRLGRSSDQTQETLDRAKKVSLEPKTRSFRSATQKHARVTECSLKRGTWKHTPRSLERRKTRSSQKPQLSGPNETQTYAWAKKPWLEPPDTKRNSRSSVQNLARAKDQCNDLARATNSSLERKTKNLGSNHLFPNTTIL